MGSNGVISHWLTSIKPLIRSAYWQRVNMWRDTHSIRRLLMQQEHVQTLLSVNGFLCDCWTLCTVPVVGCPKNYNYIHLYSSDILTVWTKKIKEAKTNVPEIYLTSAITDKAAAARDIFDIKQCFVVISIIIKIFPLVLSALIIFYSFSFTNVQCFVFLSVLSPVLTVLQVKFYHQDINRSLLENAGAEKWLLAIKQLKQTTVC